MTEPLSRRGCIGLAGAAALALLCTLAAGRMPAASSLAQGLLPASPVAGPAPGPVLARAMQRGALVVGVRSYARPAPPGAPAPAEPDGYDAALAQALADRLGLRLRLVGLAPASQDAALRDSTVDLIVAGAPDTPVGEGIALADGEGDRPPAMLVGLRAGKVLGTGDLGGQPVCVVQGSGLARALAGRHGAQPRIFPSSVHAASAFMAGECQALADHADVLQRLLRNDEWRFYRAIAHGLAPEREAVVRLPAGDGRSREWIAAALREWRRSGAQALARDARVGNVQFEVGLLKDGLVCHS